MPVRELFDIPPPPDAAPMRRTPVPEPQVPAPDLPPPAPFGVPRDRGLEIVQPLHWLSELQRKVTGLHIQVGRAYATGMAQSWPSSETFAALRAGLHDCLNLNFREP